MAQWAGQYTGRTHATAITEAERLLVQAIAAYSVADDETRTKKAKTVLRLAKRLLTVRRRQLRSSVESDETSQRGSRHADKLQQLEDGGITAILAEYEGVEALTGIPK
jgi:hypothetical protein